MDNTAMPSWERHIGKLLIGLLVVVLLANAGWEVYRYGGKSYYMRIDHSAATFPIAVPVGLTEPGFVYQGEATNATGQMKAVKFKTNADQPGPFRRGQIVRVTVNRHFGVTAFKLVSAKQVPKTVKLN